MSNHRFLMTTAAVLALASGLPAAAQVGGVEEVVVTAQRRAESLQKVPTAITAISGEQLQKAGITDMSDVASRTPSFVIGQQGPSSPDMTIRGIGSSDRDAGSDRSVVAFVDEVYTGRAGGLPADLYDLERVEVLRGPQGTLYGKNAVGGAINLITRKPSHTFDANVEATAGSDELFVLKGAIGGELAETLAGRFAFSTRSKGPIYYNSFLKKDTDDYRLYSGRGQLLWQPTDKLDVLVGVDLAHDEVDGITTHIDPVTTALAVTNYAPTPDPFGGGQNILGLLDRDTGGASVRADWRTAIGTVTTLTAYRSLKMREDRDLVGIPIKAGFGFESTQLMSEDSDSFSQEVRLASPSDQRLTWIVGAYYQKEETHRIEERKRQLNAAISRPRFDQNATTTSYAVFGQTTFAATDRLNLTLGGRYTVDQKDFQLRVTNPFGFASVSPASQVFFTGGNDEWKAFTPKVTVDYDITEDIMAYATVSRGFKSGGYQGLAATAAAARASFNPEFVTNYEAGLKTRFWDRRGVLNLSAYSMDFSDLQFRQRILTVPNDQSSAIVVVANAGTARIYGADLESSVRATDWLTLRLGYAYLESEITKFNVTTGVADVTGRDLARAPNSTLNAAIETSFTVGEGLTLGGRLDYRYRSSFWFEPSVDTALYQRGYGLVDARISLTSERGWAVELWGQNLSDETYHTFAQAVGYATNGVSAATTRTGDPLAAGVTVRWRR